MRTIKDTILQELLPNRSDQERELWYREKPEIQKVVEIMKVYCEKMAWECQWDSNSTSVIQRAISQF